MERDNLGRMTLSAIDRQRLGLDIDEPPTNQEYLPAMRSPAPGEPRVPNLKLLLKPDEKATAPKIRHLVNELLAGNLQRADEALQDLFKLNPKQALELYIELAKFSLPQLKAVAVQVDDRSDNTRSLSIAQLQQALQDT